ncbi:TonB-dependent receptor plug domain-containing protein [Helicobacter cetorum]|uniref:TonB-dependent receptor plug domain-containing protein n=1 Tax=Helicobacter cetorum TaxID=138563 RepID=UPI000CF14016|nr:TonB-dependent receptor plug domain-containing protein [Helicobacter cetorum]
MKALRLLLVFLVGLGFFSALSAKKDKSPNNAPTSWRSKKVKNHAGSRSVISNKSLKKNANQNIPESLQNIPGIQVYDTLGTGTNFNYSVRGIRGLPNHSMRLNNIPLYSPY